MLPKETVLTGADHPGTQIQILNTPAGYYLGFIDKTGHPYSRETVYMSKKEAESVISYFRGAAKL
jgi:hypothetical protein